MQLELMYTTQTQQCCKEELNMVQEELKQC